MVFHTGPEIWLLASGVREGSQASNCMGPIGFWECKCMPFGFTNAPTTFQRLMDSCLSELHLNWCIIYLDAIIVFSRTPEEHLHRLEAVFRTLRVAGLILKPTKCDLFKNQINYLGHVVSK